MAVEHATLVFVTRPSASAACWPVCNICYGQPCILTHNNPICSSMWCVDGKCKMFGRFLRGLEQQMSAASTTAAQEQYAALCSPALPVSLEGFGHGSAQAWCKQAGTSSCLLTQPSVQCRCLYACGMPECRFGVPGPDPASNLHGILLELSCILVRTDNLLCDALMRRLFSSCAGLPAAFWVQHRSLSVDMLCQSCKMFTTHSSCVQGWWGRLHGQRTPCESWQRAGLYSQHPPLHEGSCCHSRARYQHRQAGQYALIEMLLFPARAAGRCVGAAVVRFMSLP